MTATIISIIALILSLVALIYTFETFWLKTGASISGGFSTVSHIASDDKYVGTIILENLKDRAVAIYKIYLRLGYNVYIEINDFEFDPLILKPFGIFREDYGPVDFHSVGMRRASVNHLLEDKSLRPTIVLSTSEGKFTVRHKLRYWDPIADYFKNFSTAIIRPVRSEFEGRSFGSNAKFVIVFKTQEGKEQIFPIYPGDYRIKKFKNFALTKESLDSVEALNQFLLEKMENDELPTADVEVHDLKSWRAELYEDRYEEIVEVPGLGWFDYFVRARLLSLVDEFRRKRKNRARMR